MKPKGRAPFYLCWFYAIMSSGVAWAEIDVIPEKDRAFYLITKFLIVWMIIPAAFVLLKDPTSFWGNLTVGNSMVLYPGFCGYWRINYEYAVFELLMAYALAFRVPRAMFVSVCVGCIGLFGGVRVLRFDYLKAQFTSPEPLDGALIALALGMIVCIFYVFVNYERNWRAGALTRFSLIGQHASNIIHDVKNLIAAPSLHVSTLRRKLEGHSDPEVQEILEEMQSSLSRTNRLVFDLNEMARLAETNSATVVSVRKLIHEVTDLLQNQMRGIALEINGDLELRADRALLYSVYMSLFMNAADQLRRSGVAHPLITVDFAKGCCRISDNGGGFDSAVLRDLVSKGRANSTKSEGSGMGLYLVANALTELGGSATFKNSASGATVELRFST